jgi:hypothetical protein
LFGPNACGVAAHPGLVDQGSHTGDRHAGRVAVGNELGPGFGRFHRIDVIERQCLAVPPNAFFLPHPHYQIPARGFNCRQPEVTRRRALW